MAQRRRAGRPSGGLYSRRERRMTPMAATTADPSIVERVRAQKERVHVSIGAVCNNNCIFCMEEDREAREVNNGAMTPERVRWILEEHRGAEEVCFTSGEPTTRPELPELVRWAKELGYRRISVMTNGRRLSQKASGLRCWCPRST